tara:strand:+ start:1068 stop:4217 length:3150 start_codon:yes stop_codon:yes gene_type:complete
MTKDQKGGDLFIVDNSISGWTCLRYLKEWSGLAKSFDVATGYFEIGSLLELDGEWQKLDKIRVLMGDETSRRTRAALLNAVKIKAEQQLDKSIEDSKEKNPFLKGVPAIVDALKSGKIECRIFNRDKFHAKAYITHAKLDVVGSRALVGSSNFTRPGLTENIELNIQVQSGREVAQLQEWFDEHWKNAKEVTEDIVKVISRHTYLYTPFDIYAKALHEFFKGHEITAGEWEESHSRMFPCLDRYQKEAYWTLMKIARQHQGAFLCDGVGLGKTFVGLMLIERLILHEGKRVALFAPKAAKEGVWEPHLKNWLPHIGGIGGGADFSNLAAFSHTDLGRAGDFPDRFKRIAELADVFIIDEGHHFRNPGSQGDSKTGDGRSRYYKLYDLLAHAVRPKTLFILTATPINNRLADFRHMAELFTRRDETYFAKTLGVNNLRGHFNALERTFAKRYERDVFDVSERIVEAGEFLTQDILFKHLVVQRSRAYAKESQISENLSTAVFPERKPPKVAEYSIHKTYGRLLELVEKAFEKNAPLFSLSIYYPLAYYKGDDKSIDPFEEGRQKQVVGLIRTQFLKRFESSVYAFELSSDRLMKKLLAFLEVHSETDSEKKRFSRWKHQNAEILKYSTQQQFWLWGDEEDEDWEEDVIPEELLKTIKKLSRDEYNVEEIIAETFLDLDQIVSFIEETKKFKPKHDDKLNKLKRLVKSKDLKDQKVIIFTEFADTARYIFKQLSEEGLGGLAQIDSGSKTNRGEVIKQFAPYYNGTTTNKLQEKNKKEIRVLISTDVLSEGLNLQDACRMINYDIHWNPVRLMQRIGRVDRRMNPIIENQLIKDHPEVAPLRGKVLFWNFLPPEELNKILSLYSKVTHKTLLISKTLGIEGKKLLTPEDDYDALKEFNHAYEGKKTAVEGMHLEYQKLLKENPDLDKYLGGLPGSIFSGRKRPAKGTYGVFFCYVLPALDKEKEQFTEEAGTTRWYLYDIDKGVILEEPGEIIQSIRSKPNTPRKCVADQKTLIEIRIKVLKHIKNTYLKRVDAPIDVKPILKAWMELNEE